MDDQRGPIIHAGRHSNKWESILTHVNVRNIQACREFLCIYLNQMPGIKISARENNNFTASFIHLRLSRGHKEDYVGGSSAEIGVQDSWQDHVLSWRSLPPPGVSLLVFQRSVNLGAQEQWTGPLKTFPCWSSRPGAWPHTTCPVRSLWSDRPVRLLPWDIFF